MPFRIKHTRLKNHLRTMCTLMALGGGVTIGNTSIATELSTKQNVTTVALEAATGSPSAATTTVAANKKVIFDADGIGKDAKNYSQPNSKQNKRKPAWWEKWCGSPPSAISQTSVNSLADCKKQCKQPRFAKGSHCWIDTGNQHMCVCYKK